MRLALKVLRGFNEFGAARLAFRDQPLPSKPVIPGAGQIANLPHEYKFIIAQPRDEPSSTAHLIQGFNKVWNYVTLRERFSATEGSQTRLVEMLRGNERPSA